MPWAILGGHSHFVAKAGLEESESGALGVMGDGARSRMTAGGWGRLMWAVQTGLARTVSTGRGPAGQLRKAG